MALDIYVGPVSRYLNGDWKNLGQQAAEAAGIPYQIMGQPPNPGLLGRFRQSKAYNEWRSLVRKQLAAVGDSSGLWNDDASQAYSTHRPGWEGLAGFMVVYSHKALPDFAAPEGRVTPDALQTDAATKAFSQMSPALDVLGGCRLWIPGEFAGLIQVPFIVGDAVSVSSIRTLNDALDEACRVWDVNRAELEQMPLDQPGPESSWEDAGLYGLSNFCQMATYAKSHRLPMILDY